ncbi:hypothetical protein [Nitrosophilus alvini]|uniref:hypothetical protein n=1 Tax=Nitrosophilus alvini TaxID=2714855 RepID=UPI00190B7A1C|nr:hypothetical protein [Nitrosophilus alvini]
MSYPWEMPSIRNKRKKPFRPRCRFCRKNDEVIPVVYGFEITEELLEKEQKGEIKIGAAAIGADRHNWFCKRCESGFLR